MSVSFPWKVNRGPSRPLVKPFGDLPGATSLTINGLGELSTQLVAAQIQARTGIITTGQDILSRAIAARVTDPRVVNPTEGAYRAIVGILGNATDPGSALAAARPLLEPLYREYGPSAANTKLIQIIGKFTGVGFDDVLASAAINLGRSLLSTGIITDLTDWVSNVLGDSEWLSDLASTISEAVSTIAKSLPMLGAIANFQFALADWITAAWGAIHGDTVSAGDPRWANWSSKAYATFATSMGHDVGPVDGWFGEWSPFFFENFAGCGSMETLLTTVRALDVHQYKLSGNRTLPRWREVFASDTARDWVNSPAGLATPGGLNAEFVAGCGCGSFPYAMVSPYRWHQGNGAFRAAVIASCFANGTVGCIRGMGQWVSTCRGIAGGTEDDGMCYEDESPYYSIGYPFGQSVDRLCMGWWATWGGSRGWERTVYMMPPSVARARYLAISPRPVGTGQMRYQFGRQVCDRRENWIPIRELLRGHPELPRDGTAGVMSRIQPPRRMVSYLGRGKKSEGIPTVAVVGGLGLAGLLAWLALK